MTSPLQQLEIFELKPLITNLSSKLSTVIEFDARKQLLCLVSDDNEIVVRYTNENGQEILKLISWFRRTNRVIHDVCFDPTGTWLLVLCFDNTLHIVPALFLVDKTIVSQTAQYPYSTTQVTSYIIPFVGPHECPNSKKCPNHTEQLSKPTSNPAFSTSMIECSASGPSNENPSASKSQVQQSKSIDQNLFNQTTNKSSVSTEKQEQCSATNTNRFSSQPATDAQDNNQIFSLEDHSVEVSASEIPLNMLAHNAAFANDMEKHATDQEMTVSFMASKTCPYPLSVVWWQTIEGLNRAIIGYSDGSICFVGLSPNCPFVASTAIKHGSAMKLLICKESTLESSMLLITSTLKQQYKLLLEQKEIKYTYPGDISPTSAQPRESDWQIVMSLKSNSNCSDPASDSSQLEEDVFLRNDETQSSLNSRSNPPPPSHSMHLQSSTSAQTCNNPSSSSSPLNSAILTSAGISSAKENTQTTGCSSAAGGLRFQQQQLPSTDFDDTNGKAGILPAARARLASLKSLGSKKLNAIKMRLSDNRHKLEEYIPENNLGHFTIMDSPSLTPEVLGTAVGTFYTIQNLRSTYLLSALHSQSNTLSVHSMDINLKPLFLYKIPKNCHDILISSNILYSIQYVDLVEQKEDDDYHLQKTMKSETQSTGTQIEKESTSCIDGEGKMGNEFNNEMNEISSKAQSAVDCSRTEKTALSTKNNLVNAVAVISSAMASLKNGEEDKFNTTSQLGIFRFENETVVSLHQMATYRSVEPAEPISKEEKTKAFEYKEIRSPMDYVKFYETVDVEEEYSLRQMEIMKSEFPKINYDPCYVVTNKNVYYIQLRKEPFAIFLDSALAGEWTQCREFCNTFDLPYETCIEFAGDYLLRRKKVAQALLTYNSARIKPIRTALKLAMFGQTYTLMHLCAMALKSNYLLKSRYFSSPIIKTLLNDITYRHSEDVRLILPPSPVNTTAVTENDGGVSCSDYVYGVDEPISGLQLSPSSQFHLANLLLITLAEKAVNDKNYLPLWNFLVTNNKFHTNMTSIVLCQSGLFSSALILAKVRGVCIDTFIALTSVVGQEFGWYSELNVCLYNLSEPIFIETITYLPHVAIDYFVFIQEKLENIRECVLTRLEQQLNPFAAVMRPIVSHNSSGRSEQNSNDNNAYLLNFCKALIETYLAVLIYIDTQRSKHDNIINALSSFKLTYEDNQFAIETSRFKPISAGCAHCACVVDGVAYFWGSNGVPCNYSINKSADPPEPPHAVKCLETLSQLNLEVHAVKCGRQHTLILTNNGLYSFGNNNLMQLGIGSGLQMSLQPMLVRALDGKNITILEAGQYHNAAVADGLLYTWGWGVYGQLGHGDSENVPEPKLVPFFKNKKVLQVSLGHAHSLVLCKGPHNENHITELYVFGSNHFGQLGIGSNLSSMDNDCIDEMVDGAVPAAPSQEHDEFTCAAIVKCLIPIRLIVGNNERIRLIHTKFFSNLVVDELEHMYTWGSSPQALRLATQIKRRANAKQKIEEHQRREMSKRFEATMKNNERSSDDEADNLNDASTSAVDDNVFTLKAVADDTVEVEVMNDSVSNSANRLLDQEEEIASIEIDETPTTATTVIPTLLDGVVEEIINELPNKIKIIEDEPPEDIEQMDILTVEAQQGLEETSKASEGIHKSVVNKAVDSETQTRLSRKTRRKYSMTEIDTAPESVEETKPSTSLQHSHSPPANETKRILTTTHQKQTVIELDPCEHMTPHLVDTSEVAGQIKQLSSGLFHFALISSSCTLYTWGKNLEHQLGTEDKERRAVSKPAPIDSIESPMYVDCGADFTLVMSTDFMVKAFGGNSNGQCGRDLGASIDRLKQRVVCLPTTKRLMRFESQCVEIPVEINLPRPRIRLDNEPVRYLKNIPKYQSHFEQEVCVEFNNNPGRLSSLHSYKSTISRNYIDKDQRAENRQNSEELNSGLENISNNDATPLNHLGNPPEVASTCTRDNSETAPTNDPSSSCDCSPGEQSYAPLPLTENAEQSIEFAADAAAAAAVTEADIAKLDNSEELGSQSTLGDNADVDDGCKELRSYIHYCLYVFHGLYNSEKIRDFAKERLEYRIRTYMLNFNFIDAFTECLSACNSTYKSLKIFEYFTKDTSFVPTRRQDLKFFICSLFQHFIERKFDMGDCESFLLADLEYYLLELAYVLYFNNNNKTDLEQNMNEKFMSLICAPDANQNNEVQNKLGDTDAIFDTLSVKFKTIVCQRLLKRYNNN